MVIVRGNYVLKKHLNAINISFETVVNAVSNAANIINNVQSKR